MVKPARPTLQDVAREACVSTATISRTINSPDKVAPATRERIQEVIDRLGFTPNFGGKILASQQSNTVGAVIPSMDNAMFASGIQAFQETLSNKGINLLVASSGYDPHREYQQIQSLITHGADGLMLIGTARLPEAEHFLAVRDIPCVHAWNYHDNDEVIYAGFSNANAASRLAQTVIEHGHRRIAMIAGKTSGNDRALDRVKGVTSVIQNQSNNARLLQVIEVDYSLEAGAQAFAQLMALAERPSAIMCGNDVIAAGAILRANEMSIKVPEEVSITGFDDITLASVVAPALTTVRIPQFEMGQCSANLLLRLLAKDKHVQSEQFDAPIIIRQSLAAPPN